LLLADDPGKVTRALAPGKGEECCPDCGKPTLLREVMEAKLDSPAVREQVREERSEGQAVIDNERRELLAAHHRDSSWPKPGKSIAATRTRITGLMARSSSRTTRAAPPGSVFKETPERWAVFQIKNPRWADYWQQQAYAVMLVIRTSDGEIRWMDVSAYLKRESAGGKTVRQIIFEGERFDAMSVQNWRKKVLVSG
jgi:hypothetical protein